MQRNDAISYALAALIVPMALFVALWAENNRLEKLESKTVYAEAVR